MAPDRLDRLEERLLPGGLRLAEARTPRARLVGLAGLATLEPGRGLHLFPARSVHTAGMRFALDLLWLDRRDRVVRVDEHVRPWRHRACRRARSVIETRAGEGAAFAEVLQAPSSR
jgi:uncharacterized membrane protein (UPF0127 family)